MAHVPTYELRHFDKGPIYGPPELDIAGRIRKAGSAVAGWFVRVDAATARGVERADEVMNREPRMSVGNFVGAWAALGVAGLAVWGIASLDATPVTPVRGTDPCAAVAAHNPVIQGVWSPYEEQVAQQMVDACYAGLPPQVYRSEQ